jgi:hypothetical protein
MAARRALALQPTVRRLSPTPQLFTRPARSSRLNTKGPRHFRPLLEKLESRVAPAVGVFNDDFSNYADPTKAGFDTAADGLEVVNDLPRYGVTQGPTGRGGYYYLQDGNPGDPGWGLHADGHILAITGSNPVPQVTFTVPPVGAPGGLEAGEEVSGIGVSVQGFGRVDIHGSEGNLTVHVNGGFTWQRIAAFRDDVLPGGGQLGAILELRVYSFEFVAMDNLTVAVSGSDPNDPPLAVDDLIVVDREFGQSEIFNPIENDTDADGDSLELVFNGQPARGTIAEVRDLFGNFRGFTYRADADALTDPTFREDSFNYIIRDTSFANDTATVRLVLNTIPGVNFDEYELPHGAAGPLHIDAAHGLLANDSDRDGDTLTVTGHGQPRHGEVTISPDGSFQYMPTTPGTRVLPDSFTYTVSDGFVTSTSEVFILVPNSAPVATGGTVAAPHNAPTPLNGSFAALDADGDSLTAVLVEDADQGQVTRLEVVNGRVEFEYETALGVVRGPASFSYRLFDGYGYSSVATVEIRVPNQAPVAHPDFYWPSENLGMVRIEGDRAYLVGNVLEGISVWSHFSLPPEVFASIDQGADTDGDDDPLRVAEIIEYPRFGTLISWNDEGDFLYELPSNWTDSVHDIPEEDLETAIDSFRYRMSDGVASSETTAYLHRHQFGNVFLPYPLKYEVPSGQPLFVPAVIGLTSFAPDHVPLTYTIERFPEHGTLEANHGGSFRYEPEPGFVGVDRFLINIQSARPVTPREVTIVVRNSAPQTLPDAYWAKGDQDLFISAANGVLANDSDPDGHALRLDSIGTPAGGQILRIQDDGSFTYRPNPDFRGRDTFQYQASDAFGGLSTGTITVEVVAPADAGELQNIFTPTGHHVALQSSPGATLANVNITATPPGTPPGDAVFPLGYFQFEIRGVAPGGAATVRVLLPADAPLVNEYWKFGPTQGNTADHWYRLVTSAPAAPHFSGAIVLPFVDGGSGDSDLLANGVIVDPGGPAFIPPPNPGVKVVDRVLQIVGTARADVVGVARLFGQLLITATFLPGGLRVLPASGIDRVEVRLREGNDLLIVAGNVGVPAILDGGEGDDLIYGGGGAAILLGGGGTDRLTGGSGRNVIIGGTGRDQLSGGAASDLLIAGTTSYDANDAALLRVLQEWTCQRSYSDRVANLRGGLGPVLSPSGTKLKKGETIFDDLDADELRGGSESDWLLYDLSRDIARDRKNAEAIN